MAKRKTPAQELTLEDRIEQAWKVHHRALEITPPVTPGRELQVGDFVEIGNLEDCVVVETRNEGCLVLVDYTRTDNNYGKPVRHTGMLGVWPWTSCLRLEDIKETQVRRPARVNPSYLSGDVSSLLHIMLHRGLVDNPEYQRGYVWTGVDKTRLLDSVFHERNLGTFLFVEYPYPRYKGAVEVLDGKQRMGALMDFYTSKIPYQGAYYHELSRADRYTFGSVRVQYALLDGENLSRAALLETFLNVNSAGVPQSEEHLAHVRVMLAEAERAEAV